MSLGGGSLSSSATTSASSAVKAAKDLFLGSFESMMFLIEDGSAPLPLKMMGFGNGIIAEPRKTRRIKKAFFEVLGWWYEDSPREASASLLSGMAAIFLFSSFLIFSAFSILSCSAVDRELSHGELDGLFGSGLLRASMPLLLFLGGGKT